MPAVTAVKFQRLKDSIWEDGIAITQEPWLHNIFLIFPTDGTSQVDALTEVHKYYLRPHSGSFEF